MSDYKFATTINCMDGRTQIPVIEWLKKEYVVDFVDTITEPGPNKILAEAADTTALESIKKRVGISVNKHHSRVIAVVGHYKCAGNPSDKETQITHLFAALKTVRSWGFAAELLGLWVEPSPDDSKRWLVQRVL
jgi:hypothetical protein